MTHGSDPATIAAPIVVSLFAGCGGLDKGLLDAIPGAEIHAYELDRAACDTYPLVTGCGRIEQADLTRIDYGSLPDCDGIVGGVPCQPFSTAGKRQGITDSRNLWPNAIEIIKAKTPSWFLFENVPALARGDSRDYFFDILDQLTNLNYSLSWRILNAADFGVPQTRERLFVVGTRNFVWRWPTPTHSPKQSLFGGKIWVSTRSALAEWFQFPDRRSTEITTWLSNRYPKGLPDDVLFGHQQSWGGKTHRSLNEPAFTIDASHSVFKIREHGQNWIVDNRALAILQTLPPCVTKRRLIGNAVPPVLARAIFDAARATL